MKTTSFAAMIIFYGKFHSKSIYLITAMFKVSSQQLRRTLITTFERHLTLEDFKNMNRYTCQACTNTVDLCSIYMPGNFCK